MLTPHHAEASIVADSMSHEGKRLTTFLLRYWRPIHPELMTHRVFSRSVGSSRARPSKAIIDQVYNDPWGPLHWGKNQPGMQALEELVGNALSLTKDTFHQAAREAAFSAQIMLAAGAHKQVVNRILEPFTYADVVVTSTSWNNWWELRNHPDAQPEIQDLARAMLPVFHKSTPMLLNPGEWHLPFVMPEEIEAYGGRKDPTGNLRKISTARCARTSYKAFDGTVAPLEKDLGLFHDLMVQQPVHASPSEHQATPDTLSRYLTFKMCDDGDMVKVRDGHSWDNPHLHGNFDGWIQHRKTIPNEHVPG